MSKKNKIPRGIRNNNPLNIRIGNKWKGERLDQFDKDFEQFEEMEWGIRAGFKLLCRYIRFYRRKTIADIISAWAPSNENDTQRYINTVSKLTGIDPKEVIRFEDKDVMVRLVDAMIRVECGQPVEREVIEKGYTLAFI